APPKLRASSELFAVTVAKGLEARRLMGEGAPQLRCRSQLFQPAVQGQCCLAQAARPAAIDQHPTTVSGAGRFIGTLALNHLASSLAHPGRMLVCQGKSG